MRSEMIDQLLQCLSTKLIQAFHSWPQAILLWLLMASMLFGNVFNIYIRTKNSQGWILNENLTQHIIFTRLNHN